MKLDTRTAEKLTVTFLSGDILEYTDCKFSANGEIMIVVSGELIDRIDLDTIQRFRTKKESRV